MKKKPKLAYSPCKYARRYDQKHIRCNLDKSIRHVGKARGCNACNPSICLRYRPELVGKDQGAGMMADGLSMSDQFMISRQNYLADGTGVSVLTDKVYGFEYIVLEDHYGRRSIVLRAGTGRDMK